MTFDQQRANQGMSSTLDHVIQVVQRQFAQFEKNIFTLSLSSTRGFAERRPVVALFLTIFTILSAIPFLCFIGFTLIITTLFTIAGIITALLASGTLILGAGALLTVILGVTFFTALFSTATFLTIFAFYKMGVAAASGRDIRESIPPWVMGRGNLALTQNSVDVKVEPPTPSSTGDWQAVEGQSSKQDTL